MLTKVNGNPVETSRVKSIAPAHFYRVRVVARLSSYPHFGGFVNVVAFGDQFQWLVGIGGIGDHVPAFLGHVVVACVFTATVIVFTVVFVTRLASN